MKPKLDERGYWHLRLTQRRGPEASEFIFRVALNQLLRQAKAATS